MRTSVLRNAHLFCARKKPGDSLNRLDSLFEPDLNAASFPSLRKRCQLPGIRTPCTRNGSRFSQSSRCPHPPQGCHPVSLLMPDATASPTRSTPLALAPDGANAGQIDSRQTLRGILRTANLRESTNSIPEPPNRRPRRPKNRPTRTPSCQVLKLCAITTRPFAQPHPALQRRTAYFVQG